jgi:hypothetical protein
MGWSEDLLLSGLITEDEYEDMKDIGYDIRHFGDVEALQDLLFIAYDKGLDELGDRLINEYDSAIGFYEEANDFKISYDAAIKRWRDVETGRFVKDPYEMLR